MRARQLGLALLWLGCAGAAHGQKIWAAKGGGNNIVVGGGVSVFKNDYGHTTLGGLMTYADANFTWRYGVEGEARTLRYHADEGVTQSSYMVGPRAYLLSGNMRPYAKALIGVGKMTFPFKYATGSYVAYGGGAGVDWLVGDRLIVRVVDFEYQMWPQFTYGEITPYGISVGISYRVNGMKRMPTR